MFKSTPGLKSTSILAVYKLMLGSILWVWIVKYDLSGEMIKSLTDSYIVGSIRRRDVDS